jgi:hypothetical protein
MWNSYKVGGVMGRKETPAAEAGSDRHGHAKDRLNAVQEFTSHFPLFLLVLLAKDGP